VSGTKGTGSLDQETVHLSVNNTVQGASTHGRLIPCHTVIKCWWHK